MHASASATDSETDLKLPIIADADTRCIGSSAFETRFVAVGDHTGDAYSITGATMAVYSCLATRVWAPRNLFKAKAALIPLTAIFPA